MNRHEIEAIEAVLRSQFAALSWGSGRIADWPTFESGFRTEARLYPAARPATALPVAEFRDRMDTLAGNGTLQSFEEKPTGIQIMQHGNIAVALAGCEMLENGSDTTRDVNAILLIKDDGEWRIAAQAWDRSESDQECSLLLCAD